MANKKNKKQKKKNSAVATAKKIDLDSALDVYNYQERKAEKIANSFKSSMSDYLHQATAAQQAADEYNSLEAQKQRDWSQMMSATAHQREVKDLEAAGLNPILSANAGAPVTSAAAAQTSNNLTNVMGSMAMNALSALGNITQTMQTNSAQMVQSANQTESSYYATNVSKYASELSARTNLSMNQATNRMNYNIAKLNAMNQQQIAHIAGQYGLSNAQIQAFVNKYSSELAYDASMYAANKQSETTLEATKANNETQKMNTAEGVIGGLIGDLLNFLGKKKK